MSTQDIRWQQRFSNYGKALFKLEEAVLNIRAAREKAADGQILADSFWSDIIKEGLIQRFEYTHELAWHVMKDFLVHAGNAHIFGSKDATREAFSSGLIDNGGIWMDMIQSRNKTSHTYNEATANEIFLKILDQYYPEFIRFKQRMAALGTGQEGDLP